MPEPVITIPYVLVISPPESPAVSPTANKTLDFLLSTPQTPFSPPRLLDPNVLLNQNSSDELQQGDFLNDLQYMQEKSSLQNIHHCVSEDSYQLKQRQQALKIFGGRVVKTPTFSYSYIKKSKQNLPDELQREKDLKALLAESPVPTNHERKTVLNSYHPSRNDLTTAKPFPEVIPVPPLPPPPCITTTNIQTPEKTIKENEKKEINFPLTLNPIIAPSIQEVDTVVDDQLVYHDIFDNDPIDITLPDIQVDNYPDLAESEGTQFPHLSEKLLALHNQQTCSDFPGQNHSYPYNNNKNNNPEESSTIILPLTAQSLNLSATTNSINMNAFNPNSGEEKLSPTSAPFVLPMIVSNNCFSRATSTASLNLLASPVLNN